MKRVWRALRAALVPIVATLAATLLVLNLSLGNKEIDRPLQTHYAVADAQFERVMGAVLTPDLVHGNRLRELVNGEQIFPAMLGAIRSASASITLESYIYWSGSVGQDFSDALIERAQAGVHVKVLLDWVGSDLNDSLLEQMRAAGIDVRRYNPPRWYSLGRMNHRTHRRLLVVDGRIGFIGGAGLADKWRGAALDPQHWRDTHFQVEGPVVAQLQSAFIDNWVQTTGELLHGERWLPVLDDVGTAKAHVFSASPGGGAKSMQLMYLMSITAARHSIDLSAAYFVPDEVSLAALVAALQRGVRLRIILPGPHIDRRLLLHASRATWGRLLEKGAQIHTYQPTMFHCKVMVVDGLWVSVGSTNFDSRSFSINDEANLNVHDAAFAQRQTAVFEHDLTRTQAVTLQDWEARSRWEKSLDTAASLLSSQL